MHSLLWSLVSPDVKIGRTPRAGQATAERQPPRTSVNVEKAPSRVTERRSSFQWGGSLVSTLRSDSGSRATARARATDRERDSHWGCGSKNVSPFSRQPAKLAVQDNSRGVPSRTPQLRGMLGG
eukprot:6304153-Prymnesium_polylepis.1